MARMNSAPENVGSVTLERAVRLYRLLSLVGRGPQTRASITRKLKLGIRGFYRDLELLRAVGIEIKLAKRKYLLTEDLASAVERLPFPDPGLSLGEARTLAKGRSKAHRKIREQLQQIGA